MKTFIHDDFMLNNEPAKILYHDYAKDMPIIDYHCHLSPKDIDNDQPFNNLTEEWLSGDHYKWRAMRSAGIEEKYITGDATDYEKFLAWAKTVPQCIGNPLYHWTHLELKRYFDVDTLLNEDTGPEVWEHCNKVLKSGELTPQAIIHQSNVKMVGTTDDPLDNLEYHKAIKTNEAIKTKVLPTFRPDSALAVNHSGFSSYVVELAKVTNSEINTFEQFLNALEERVHYFHEVGCRISDHGLEYLVYDECSFEEVATIFEKRQEGFELSSDEEHQFKTYMMLFLGRLYASLNWAMQLHIGAIRNNNTRMFNQIGANTGFDSIGDYDIARPLNQLLNALDQGHQLPKTIIYNLNSVQNDVVASAAGNFQSEGIKGKVQFGSGWWFNDQKDGMVKQMTNLANIGSISHFVGMLTDSRSFFSYTRHEYFRRILCDLFGQWIVRGEVPMDYQLLGKIVQDICFNNANAYFELNV